MAEIKPLQVTAGPFIGQADTPALSAQDATRARKLVNMIAYVGALGDLISRPRFTRVSFAAVAGTGTISFSGGPAAVTITGVGTSFTTQVSVGDLLTAGGSGAVVTVITNNTTITATAQAGTISGAAFTITPAAISGGQILGQWQHTLTTGVTHRFLLVTTTNAAFLAATRAGVGVSAFVASTGALIRLVEWMPGATAPYQVLVDRTSVSMNAVSLGVVNRLYATSFANYFIITDGTNRPRKIDSSFVLTNLSDANYAFFGPLTVYYGDLMGIDASDQITLRWSEPNDPDTGYGTGTSDLSWSLQQTSSDPVMCVIGTNQALFVFRSNSVAIITGASNSDFASSGAVDAVQSIGTRSPDAVLLAGASVVFLDQYLRPGRIQLGYGYIPLWTRIQETLRGVGKTVALEANAWGRLDPTTNLVKFGYRGTSSSTQNEQMLVFDATSFECLGTHIIPVDTNRDPIDHGYSTNNPQSSAPMLDATGLPIHVVASGLTSDCAFYWQDHEDVPANVSQDVIASGPLTVQGTVTPPLIGGDVVLEKGWDRVVVGTRNVGGAATGIATIQMQYRTPYTTYSTASDMIYGNPAAPPGVHYDGMTVKVEANRLTAQPSRYLDLTFQNDVSGNVASRFTFDTVTVIAHPTDSQAVRS